MKKYLVIGNPIEHSLSPKLHNYWINKNSLEATYDKKLISENEIESLIKEIKDDIKVYPIHYLFWSSIEYFLNKKYKYFWIGEKANKNIKNLSDIEKNLSFFKEGWGGEEAQWTQVEKKFYE